MILGNDEKVQIPFSLARMVFDLPKFEMYPWGRLAFKTLIKSMRAVDLEADSYTIHGFIQTVQIWAYNVVPLLGSQIGHPSNSETLPLLKFSGGKKKTNINIDAMLVNDQDKIEHEHALAVWGVEDVEGEDKKIDTLMEALCKEGGLRIISWVAKDIEKDREDETEVNGGDKSSGDALKVDRTDGNAQKISLKSQKEMKIKGRKKRKNIESKAPIFSLETSSIMATFRMRIEKLEKQVTNAELVQARMEDQLKGLEVMSSTLEFLEKEVKLLRAHRVKQTPKDFNPYSLKDESIDMPLDEILANINTIKKRALESDGESTVDGRPLQNVRKDLLQQSSQVEILKSTAALVEKCTQKKIDKTIKGMGIDNAVKTEREKSKRIIKPAPSIRTPFKSINPAVGIPKQVNQPMMVDGRGYDPFELVDVQKVKVLEDYLQLDEEYPIGSQNNAVDFFEVLRTPQDWLNEEHINSAMNLLRLRFMKNEKVFRSGRIAFTDAFFTTIWSRSYEDFLREGKVPIFPNGAFDYVNGKLPAFAETGKKWRTDVDDIYGILNIKNNRWVSLFISIPYATIDVFDCGLGGSTNKDITDLVMPFAHMLPHLLRAAAPPSERPKLKVERYKIRRPRRGIPQMLKSGDCGIYAIKFVECHALGVTFNTALPDTSIKMVREKLAAEIFDETQQHGTTVSNPFPFGENDRELLKPY